MGQGQGLTDALLDLELYFLLVPLVVDESKEMFSLADGATDLVIIGGLSQIAFVQMPVNRSITAGVGGLEDKFLGLPGEAFRKVENGVMLGIDQFDLAVQVLPAAGFYRRERDIIDVIVAVVILLRGWKHEPRAADHPVDRLAGTIDPVPSVRR